jgi:hypothetical protein
MDGGDMRKITLTNGILARMRMMTSRDVGSELPSSAVFYEYVDDVLKMCRKVKKPYSATTMVRLMEDTMRAGTECLFLIRPGYRIENWNGMRGKMWVEWETSVSPGLGFGVLVDPCRQAEGRTSLAVYFVGRTSETRLLFPHYAMGLFIDRDGTVLDVRLFTLTGEDIESLEWNLLEKVEVYPPWQVPVSVLVAHIEEANRQALAHRECATSSAALRCPS